MKLNIFIIGFIALILFVSPVMATNNQNNNPVVNNYVDVDNDITIRPDVDVDNYNHNDNYNYNDNDNFNTNKNYNTNINNVDVDQSQKQNQNQMQVQLQHQEQDQAQDQQQTQSNYQVVTIQRVAPDPGLNPDKSVGVGVAVEDVRLIYPGEVVLYDIAVGQMCSVRAGSPLALYTIRTGISDDTLKVKSSESTPEYDPVYNKMVWGLVDPADFVKFFTPKAKIVSTVNGHCVIDNRARYNDYTTAEIIIDYPTATSPVVAMPAPVPTQTPKPTSTVKPTETQTTPTS